MTGYELVVVVWAALLALFDPLLRSAALFALDCVAMFLSCILYLMLTMTFKRS